MPNPTNQRRTLSLRFKIASISLLSFLVATACSLLRQHPTPTPNVTCYTMPPPTEPVTPIVECYEVMLVTETPTPPTSPLPTPTPTPTPAPEARRLLLEELLAEGRFPQDVVWQLDEAAES